MKRKSARYGLLIMLLPGLWAAAEPRFQVATTTLEPQTIAEELHVYGRVEDNPQFLYFELAGYLDRLRVDLGDQVVAGQELAALDTEEIDHQIRRVAQTVRYNLTKLGKTQRLNARQLASEDQLDDREHVHAIEQIELQRLKDRRARHFLYAPSDGEIIERQVDFPGPIDATTPIFRFKRADAPILVHVELTQGEITRVSLGDRARISNPERKTPEYWPGWVIKIHPGSQADGLFRVEIAVEDDSETSTLTPGLQVDVTLLTGTRLTGYRIPIAALVSIEADQAGLFVVDEERAKRLHVGLFRILGDAIMTRDDLSAYTDLIVTGQHYLNNGARVEIDRN